VSDTFRIEDGVGFIGEKEYRWAQVTHHDSNFDDFRVRGLRLNFENGWVLSVIWGTGSYSANKYTWDRDRNEFREESPTAEIAAWNAHLGSELVVWADSSDQVMGWLTPEQVNRLIVEMMGWESEFFPARAEIGGGYVLPDLGRFDG
jgi:hypothetical protein